MKFFSKEKKYPSLIISEEKLQVLSLDHRKEKVESLAQLKLPASLIKSGEVKDEDKLAQAIQELFKSAKIGERFVVVGIPENTSYSKLLTLPSLKADELAEAVVWEAETYLPIAIDQVYLDWKIIDKDAKNEVKILLVAVPKEIIDGYTSTLKKAGLTPVAYETTSLSLVRLVEDLKQRTLVIDVGLRLAVLTLANGQLVEASSIVQLTGDCSQISLTLSETVNKMLVYYEDKLSAEEKVKTIYFSGEGVTPPLLEQIHKGTGREVKTASLPTGNLPENQALSFSVISSLALKAVRSPGNETTINLLPADLQANLDNLEKEKSGRFILSVSIVILSLLVASSLGCLIYLTSLQSSLEAKKLSLSQPPDGTGQAISETNNLNKAASTIVKVNASRVFPQQRLVKILPAVSDQIIIININFNENLGKLKIVGKANTRDEMLKFRDRLEASGEISNTVLPLSSLQQANNVDFILTADLKPYAD